MTIQERKDVWTQEDDQILARTVLQHIRSGSTQLKAFEEVAELLTRTPAACGFRWNSEVRKQHDIEIAEAKQERMTVQKKRNPGRSNLNKSQEPESVRNHPLFAAIKIINQYIGQEAKPEPTHASKIEELTALVEKKDREIKFLKQQLEEAREAEFAVTEDYKMLLRILERARALGVLGGAEEDSRAAFKMDANGNLERIG